MPLLFYKLGLGALLGQRFLLINHTGRKSGLPRQVALEVVNHDPQSGEYFVNVGFGPKSDWYLNLRKEPKASIQVGTRKIIVRAAQTTAKEGGQLLRVFAQKHPYQVKSFSRFLGYETDGTLEDITKMGEALIFMRLTPLTT